MRETVVEFGPGRRLVGVLCRPDVGTPGSPICVVLTNSGIIHRAGANRLHVRLARRLAAAGVPSFRYDLPGIGDSEAGGAGMDLTEEQIAGTRAGFDALEKLGVAHAFVMLGICSGAAHSLLTGVADERVRGAVLIDPAAAVATRRHRLNQVLDAARRGLRPRVWWRLLRGRYQLRQMVRDRSIEPVRPGMPMALPNSAEQDTRRLAADALGALARRRVRLLLVITGHNRGIYSYRRQLFDAFPEVSELEAVTQIELRPTAGHTFGSEVDRRFLEDLLIRWLTDAESSGSLFRAPAGAGLPRRSAEPHAPVGRL